MSTTTRFNNTLFRLYEHYVGEPDSKKDVYGYWLFVLGFVVAAMAVVLYAGTYAIAGSENLQVNRVAGTLGALGLALGLFGIVLMLPVRRRGLQASAVGFLVSLVGVGSFGMFYPSNIRVERWGGSGPDWTIEVVAAYALGIGLIATVTALIPVVTGRKGMFVEEEGASDDPPVLTGDALDGAQFAVFRDEEGDWRWHVLHLEALGASEGSALTRPDAEAGIERVKSQIGSAGLMELTTSAFRLYETRDGRWQWTLVRDDGSVVARCGEEFPDRDGAEESVSFLKDRGPVADVIEIEDAAFTYHEERDRWYWRLLDADRRPLAESADGYVSRADAETAADVFVERYDDARLLAFEHVAVELLDGEDGWTWRLVDTDDEEVARSTEAFDSRRDAEEAVESLLPALESASVTVAGEPAYELFESGDDWRWRLVDEGERVIARNPDDATTYEEIEDGTERFAANALEADAFEIEDAAYETYPVGEHWRWRLVTEDRSVVAASTEPHETADEAAEAIERMAGHAKEADLIEFENAAFQVYEADDGEWRWRLIDEDGNVLADSGAEHDSKSEAAEDMMTLKQQAPDAEILEIDTAAFELFVDDGEWGWRLIDDAGKLVAEDPAAHPDRASAREAMDRLVEHLEAEVRRMETAGFQTYVEGEDWHWRFVLPEGDVVAESAIAHPTRDELVEGLDSVREAAASALTHSIGDVTVQLQGSGTWRWRLLDRDREAIATSDLTYRDRDAAEAAVEALTDHAADAPIFQIEDALVRLTNGDGWGWELVDAEREVLASAGERAGTKADAVDDVEEVRRLAPLAGRVDFDVASFELASTAEGWGWRLIDEDGETVAESVETYESSERTREALAGVRELITSASILEIDGVSFELHAADDGWVWSLVDEHGEVLSESTKTYESRTDAREAMNAVKAYAPEGWITFTE